jgi:D-lactate dehydrogenase
MRRGLSLARASRRGLTTSTACEAPAVGTSGSTSGPGSRRRSGLVAGAREVGAPPAGARANAGMPQVAPDPERFVPGRVRPTAVPDSVRVAVAEPSGFVNVDGQRIEDGRYAAFMRDIGAFIPAERVITDSVRTFAYGTDASFYRLNPRVVVKISSEEEARRILPLARKHRTPVTFRAAGTSLSGQAVTDSVMLKLSHGGKAFRNYEIKVRDCSRGAWRPPGGVAPRQESLVGREAPLLVALTLALTRPLPTRTAAGSSPWSRALSAVR